ncbi:hypothetical protein ABEP12_02030 [Bacillus velezensis]
MQTVSMNKEYRMNFKGKIKLFFLIALPLAIFLFFFSAFLFKGLVLLVSVIACLVLIQEFFFVLLGIVSLITIIYFSFQAFT